MLSPNCEHASLFHEYALPFDLIQIWDRSVQWRCADKRVDARAFGAYGFPTAVNIAETRARPQITEFYHAVQFRRLRENRPLTRLNGP